MGASEEPRNSNEWPWGGSWEIAGAALRNPSAPHNKNHSSFKQALASWISKLYWLYSSWLRTVLFMSFGFLLQPPPGACAAPGLSCCCCPSLLTWRRFLCLTRSAGREQPTNQSTHTFYCCSCQAEQVHNTILPRVSWHFFRSDKVGIHRKDLYYIYI